MLQKMMMALATLLTLSGCADPETKSEVKELKSEVQQLRFKMDSLVMALTLNSTPKSMAKPSKISKKISQESNCGDFKSRVANNYTSQVHFG